MDISTVIWTGADIARDLNLEIGSVSTDGFCVSFCRGDSVDIVTIFGDGALLFKCEHITAADYRALLGIAKYHELELIEVQNG